jgi:hypothetical protein
MKFNPSVGSVMHVAGDSPRGGEIMKAKPWTVMLSVAALTVFMALSLAGAETIKGRQVQFITKAEVLQVGDVPDHIIGIYDQTGLASFETGEVASMTIKGTLDYIKGSGPIRGYTITTYEDGSTTSSKYQGTTRPDPGGKGARWETTWTYIQGSGRWAGIQGGGTSTGRRFVPFGGRAQLYSDVIGTYTLPAK